MSQTQPRGKHALASGGPDGSARGPGAAIVVVTPNAAIDITYDVPEPRLGETNIVTEVTRRPGGKGVNVSSVLAQLGVPVRMSGFLGGRAGEEMRDLLAGWSAEQDWVDLTDGTTRCTTAIRDASGAATLFNEPGPAVTADDWRRLTETAAGALRTGSILVISGSWPPGTAPEHVSGLLAAARQRGARTIVDTSGPSLLAVADMCDVVKPNREELLSATGAPDIATGARALLERGTKAVVVSDGPRGMDLYAASGGACDGGAPVGSAGPDDRIPDSTSPAGGIPDDAVARWHADAPRIEAVNPTGAGDSAVAALAADLAAHPEPGALRPEAIAVAVAVSAAAVQVPVAGVVDLDAYRQLLPTIKVERICP
ncbi:MAG: PfkB family carbohydrate kinase [Actinomycetaceae bacterium]|nr:PfkB family carbohydrate kinase [Actinomycetaceae bacterium]